MMTSIPIHYLTHHIGGHFFCCLEGFFSRADKVVFVMITLLVWGIAMFSVVAIVRLTVTAIVAVIAVVTMMVGMRAPIRMLAPAAIAIDVHFSDYTQ